MWQSLRGTKQVAVKMLKAGSSEEDKVKFLQEAAINGQFRHINVVRLMGVVTLDEPVRWCNTTTSVLLYEPFFYSKAMIVLELLSNGDLRKYLLNQRPTCVIPQSLYIQHSSFK